MPPPRSANPGQDADEALRSRKTLVRLALAAIVVLVVLLGAGFAYDFLVLENPKFKIAKVEIQGLTRSDENDFRRRHKLDKLPKTNLFAVDIRTIQKSIAADPLVRKATVRRHLPGRISISVEERIPVAILMFPGGCAVDSAGNVMPPLNEARYAALPLIVGDKSLVGLKPGNELPPEIKPVVNLANFITSTVDLAGLLDVQRYQVDTQAYVPSVVMILRERFPFRQNALVRVPLQQAGKEGFAEKLTAPLPSISLLVVVNDRKLRNKPIDSIDLTLNDNVPVAPFSDAPPVLNLPPPAPATPAPRTPPRRTGR